MNFKRLAKEVHDLFGNLTKKTKGQGKFIKIEDDNFEKFIIELAPRKGPYRHAKFMFMFQFDGEYPVSPPEVVCLTSIYHPNIINDNTEHNVCLNIFDYWTPNFGIEDIIQGLIFLLYQPNLGDPMAALSPTIEEEEFLDRVKISLSGGLVDGCIFEKNYGWAEYEKEIAARNVDVEVTSKKILYSEAANDDTRSVSEVSVKNCVEIETAVPHSEVSSIHLDNIKIIASGDSVFRCPDEVAEKTEGLVSDKQEVAEADLSMQTLRIGIWENSTLEAEELTPTTASLTSEDDICEVSQPDVIDENNLELFYYCDAVCGRFTPPSSYCDSDEDEDNDFDKEGQCDLPSAFHWWEQREDYQCSLEEICLWFKIPTHPPVNCTSLAFYAHGRTFLASQLHKTYLPNWYIRLTTESSLVHRAFKLRHRLVPALRNLALVGKRSSSEVDIIISLGELFINILPWLCSSFSLKSSTWIAATSD